MRIHLAKVTDERLCDGDIAVREARRGARVGVRDTTSLHTEDNQVAGPA